MGRILRQLGRLTALAALVAVAVPAAAHACPHEGAEPKRLTAKQARAAVICLINQRRQAHGVGRLTVERNLVRASQKHSKAMNKRNFFSHTGRGGSSPVSRIRAAGYMAGASSWGVAENLHWARRGRGSPKSVVASWMNSPAHRAALLSGRYEHLGVGVAMGSPTGRGERNAGIYGASFGYRSG